MEDTNNLQGHHTQFPFGNGIHSLQNEPVWNGCGRPVAVENCIIRKQRARQVVTALQTIDGQLRLFSWRVNADGTIICTGTTAGQGENIVQIELTAIETHPVSSYVVGWRTAQGLLYIQRWNVSNTGAIFAIDSPYLVGKQMSWMALLMLTPSRLLTIGLGMDGKWHLHTWHLGTESTHTELASATMPATSGAFTVGQLSSTAHKSAVATTAHYFTTVAHRAPDRLGWTTWECAEDGTLTPVTQHEEEMPQTIEIALAEAGNHQLTILHTSDGNLCLFELTTDQRIPVTGNVRDFATVPTDEGFLLAAISNQDTPTLTIYQCTVAPDDLSSLEISQIGESTVPAAHYLVLCDELLAGNAPLLSAVGSMDGALQLSAWGEFPAGT